MDSNVGLIVVVICILGAGFSFIQIKKPINIRDDNTFFNWFIICIAILLVFILGFLLEVRIVGLADSLDTSSPIMMVVDKCIDGGVLIGFFAYIILMILGKIVRLLGWDYNRQYSSTFFKFCFTVFGFSLCCKFFTFAFPSSGENEEAEQFIERIAAWVIVLLGMWLNYDYPCEDRFTRKKIKEERKEKRKSYYYYLKHFIDTKNIKGFIKEILSFAGIVVISGFVIILSIKVDEISYKKIFEIYIYSGALAVSMLGTACIMKYLYNPSNCRSVKTFRRVYSRYIKDKKKTRSHYFGKMKYYIENDEIKISEVKIKVNSKMISNRLFGEKTIKILKPNKRELYVYLMNTRYYNQQAFISNEYRKLTKDKKTEKSNIDKTNQSICK